ncbi:FMN-binding negative transcriptional regulator [Janthinobacterium sp. NKUCC06_STL]|uniref:FMN-binding negative transcriptional regulator n=1 Tax=Janthinobacterium sp. NKUCC06_STL TaxID=2842127 RepID=UPI001C5AB8CC|nr:FMN-binding negative transcriptional regulator [Janthinobacterium sp. NKUCC06_STL]MBW3510356.1 FMN-binding negative transcriptional regulator [Janthinobacterium sp. NKUCC06_STL]
MYTPASFREERLDVLHGLIDAHPLGALVRQSVDGLCADHLPFEIAAPTPDAPFGILRAHVARANPLWRTAGGNDECMVIFQGPHAYITPAWYAEKQRSGKEVPTFNYAVVHAHGPLRAIDDAAWLLGLVERLTARHEAGLATPWRVSDAPAGYIEKLLKAIVGIEIPLTRLTGKWKLGQNRTQEDQATMARELAHDSQPGAAQALGALIAANVTPAS